MKEFTHNPSQARVHGLLANGCQSVFVTVSCKVTLMTILCAGLDSTTG